MTTPEPVRGVHAALKEGRAAVGISMKVPSRRYVQMAARAGMDFIRFDMSSEEMSLGSVLELAHLASENGLTSWTRTSLDREAISRLLAVGVECVTLAKVDSAEDARRVVDVCRSAQEDARRPELLVSCQIESAEGVRNVDDIVAVDGIHMLQSGRNDLARSLHAPGGAHDPTVLAAEMHIGEAAFRAGKLLSLHFPPGPDTLNQAAEWIERGLNCLTIGSDTQLLQAAVEDRLSALAGPLGLRKGKAF